MLPYYNIIIGKFFGLAGITNGESLIIITRKSSPSIAHIHGRMPMIVPESAQKEWSNNSYRIRESLDLIYAESETLLAEEEDQHMVSQKDFFY